MVLSAHNDVYGELFRNLDRLQPGDVVRLHTPQREYEYIVDRTQIVEPTAVEVMASTGTPTVTLISCYPYLVDKNASWSLPDYRTDKGLGETHVTQEPKADQQDSGIHAGAASDRVQSGLHLCEEDLRRIALLAGGFTVILVALSFFFALIR